MIKTILWDIDGTLTNFKKAEELGIKNCFEKFNLGECTKEMLKDYSEINDRYWKMLENKEITKPELLVKRFDEFFKKYKIKCNTKKFNEVYQEELRQGVVLNTGAKKVVSEIKKLNMPQYVVTNGLIESQNKKLAKVKLSSYFEKVFISDEIGHDKPTVEFFEPVLKEINEKYPDIKKDEMLIIGDSLSSDIQGGLNIGIKTCWYNPNHLKTDLPINYEIDKLSKVLEIIEQEKEVKEEVKLEVEKIVIKESKPSLKDIVDKNYRSIIVGLSAIAILFICLFIGTNKASNKTYDLIDVFNYESDVTQTIKLPSNWYISEDGTVSKLEDDKLTVTMYGYIQATSPEDTAQSFEMIRSSYNTEDLVCGGNETLFIKDIYGQEMMDYKYDCAYMVLSDYEVLCIGFINVDDATEMKILNSIK